jgi:hypothetical protein
VSTKLAVFWIVAPCSLVEVYQRFRPSVTTQKTAIFTLYRSVQHSKRHAVLLTAEPWMSAKQSTVYANAPNREATRLATGITSFRLGLVWSEAEFKQTNRHCAVFNGLCNVRENAFTFAIFLFSLIQMHTERMSAWGIMFCLTLRPPTKDLNKYGLNSERKFYVNSCLKNVIFACIHPSWFLMHSKYLWTFHQISQNVSYLKGYGNITRPYVTFPDLLKLTIEECDINVCN